jgi:uncharacterized protein YndB with AHSA1/START domain
MTRPTLPPVRQTILVNASQERAFHVFTAKYGTWTPPDHHLGPAALETVTIEPRVGGRWYERGVDGTECDWGEVLTWEPPHRVVLAWKINGEWKYDPDVSRASEVEVRFIVEGPNRTRVELEHRAFERHGSGAESVQRGVGSPEGWAGIILRFVAAAEAA